MRVPGARAARRAAARLRDRLRGVPAIRDLRDELVRRRHEADILPMLAGRLLSEERRDLPAGAPLEDAAFRVYSRAGEDGILDHLLRHSPVAHDVFVELGAGDYRVASTRFLLQRRNWRGVLVDRDDAALRAVRDDPIFWRHDLRAVHADLDAGNVRAVLAGAGIPVPVGVLAIGILDSGEWAWHAADALEPRILLVRYAADAADPAARADALEEIAAAGRERGYRLAGWTRHHGVLAR